MRMIPSASAVISAGALAFLFCLSDAEAQSGCPFIVQNAVLTPAQWQACFTAKQDLGGGGAGSITGAQVIAALGYTPVNKAGDSLLGKLTFISSTLFAAGLNMPPGAAPSSPAVGDVWMTSAGMFYVSGTAGPVGPLGPSGGLGFTPVNKAGDTMTGKLTLPASASGGAGLTLPHGAAPSSPVNGDIWTTVTGLFASINSGTVGPFIAANQPNSFSARQLNVPVALTPVGGTYTPNFSLGNLFTANLSSGSMGMANPTGLVAGYSFCIKFTNSTGAAAISTWGSAYTFPNGTSNITFTQSVNAVDKICGTSEDGSTIELTEANNFVH